RGLCRRGGPPRLPPAERVRSFCRVLCGGPLTRIIHQPENVAKEGALESWVVSLDSVYEIRTTHTCLLDPPEARDTIHVRSVPSAPVVRGWRPAVRVSKRRNSLTRCAPGRR